MEKEAQGSSHLLDDVRPCSHLGGGEATLFSYDVPLSTCLLHSVDNLIFFANGMKVELFASLKHGECDTTKVVWCLDPLTFRPYRRAARIILVVHML